jgi:phosphohistidine phosphatase
MKSKPPVQTVDALTPAGGPAAVIAELGRYMRKERIALVGHEPNMGELAAHLIGSKVPVPFKKGAICRLDFSVFPPKGKGQIVWFLPPRLLRKLA